MKVIKKDTIEKSEYPKRIVCDHCGAELEYDADDEFVGRWGMKSITCPECEEEIFVSEHRVEPPCWRASFDHINTKNATYVEDSRIQDFIDECYKYLMSDKVSSGNFYMTGSGDILVFGVRTEDTIEVYVTRDYYEDVTCL